MRRVKLTIGDDVFRALKSAARDAGLEGTYAVSNYCKMLAYQSIGHHEGRRSGVFVVMAAEERERIKEYVTAKKGYAGTCPEASFLLKAGFDIMAKYPAKKGASE